MESKQQTSSRSVSTQVDDLALGCFLGAACGDACGAVLEWAEYPVPDEKVEWALSLPGTGPHNVAPGQITDDTEQALCVAAGLAEGQEPGVFPLDNVARWLFLWLNSTPFDVGQACGGAFAGGWQALHTPPPHPFAKEMSSAALKASAKAQSNGSLMRCTPVAIWGSGMLLQNLEKEFIGFIKSHCLLSHPHEVCVDSEVCYVLAVAHLLAYPGDAEGAIQRASTWAVKGGCCEKVQQWLAAGLRGEDPGYKLPPGNGFKDNGIAFIQWGFQNAFRHLKRRSTWVEGVREMLVGGGDADTNAAIVGGMLGALHGAQSIPVHIKNVVLESDTAAMGYAPRPPFLRAGKIPALAAALIRANAATYDDL